ncbi:class I SAM-dependent methyltransferase [Alicyclobacillus hesperidum]
MIRNYALDIEPKMLEELQFHLAQQHVSHVKVITDAMEDVPLEDAPVHHVIVSFVMHKVQPLSKGIDEIYRVRKPGCHCLFNGKKNVLNRGATRTSDPLERYDTDVSNRWIYSNFSGGSDYVLVLSKDRHMSALKLSPYNWCKFSGSAG